MKRIKVKCPDCGQEISKNNISNHQGSKACVANQKGIKPIIKIQNDWEQSNGKYKCPYCDKEYTKKGIATHIWRTHGDGKDWTGNIDTIKNSGISAWNKGLTAETDERVKQRVVTLKERYKNGELIGSFTGKTQSDENKKKISDGMKKAYKNGLAIGWSRRKILENDSIKANEKSYFYIGLFEIDDYRFIKIGTAKNGFYKRYNSVMYKKYKKSLIIEKEMTSLEVLNFEQLILKKYNKFKFEFPLDVLGSFHGYSECLVVDCIGDLIKEL